MTFETPQAKYSLCWQTVSNYNRTLAIKKCNQILTPTKLTATKMWQLLERGTCAKSIGSYKTKTIHGQICACPVGRFYRWIGEIHRRGPDGGKKRRAASVFRPSSRKNIAPTVRRLSQPEPSFMAPSRPSARWQREREKNSTSLPTVQLGRSRYKSRQRA